MKAFFNLNYLNILCKVVKLVHKVDRKYLYTVVAAMVFSSLIPAFSLKIMQSIINTLQNGIENLKEILILVLFYLALDFLLIIVNSFVGYYKERFVLNFNLEIKRMILNKASRLQLDDFENSEIYDMLQRAESQGAGGLNSYFEMTLNAAGALITGISYFAIVIAFQVWIAPLLILIPILRFFISSKINKEEFQIVRNRTDDERKAWYDSYVITCGINYKELKLYNLFSHFMDKYDFLMRKFMKQDLGISKKRLKYMMVFNLFEQILTGALFSYTILCGFAGRILIGDVITYTRAMVATKGQMQNVIATFAQLNKSGLFIEQLFDFFNIKESSTSGNIIVNEIKSISIKNLSYKYRGSNKFVLRNINLEIKKGEFIAIVGRNGSGKSTLMKILLGLYDDYEGQIFINDINIREIDRKSFMKHIGALFQDFTKYEGTIRENVCYSNLIEVENDEKITRVCNGFELGNLLSEQEKGLDTQLGYWFESGKQVSFGQWQKIALSRTIMRDADLYFLDEPNAAMDAISEYELSKLYEKVFVNKIGIVIVHKFNHFINNANKIIVLEDGQVVGNGSHEELIKKSIKYKQLYDLQT